MSFKDDLAGKGNWSVEWKDNYMLKQENKMCKINFRTITGDESPYYYLKLDTDMERVRKASAEFIGKTVDIIRLVKDGKQLKDGETLEGHAMEWGGIYTIHMLLRLRGGILGGGKRIKRKTRRKSRRRKSRRRKSRRRKSRRRKSRRRKSRRRKSRRRKSKRKTRR